MAPNPRFFRMTGPLTAEEAARIGGAAVVQDSGRPISSVAQSSEGGEGALVFAQKMDAVAPASAVLLPLGAADQQIAPSVSVLEAKSPKLAFALIASHLFRSIAEEEPSGSDPELGEDVRIDPRSTIARGVEIGRGTSIGPHAFIGPGVTLGEGCRIGAQVSITHASLGAGCSVLAGAKIGEAGFGYVAGPDGPVAMPQLGAVRIEGQVDIGALTTVDRGTLSDTVIGARTKIDNLCQIAHNCRIGSGVLIASQTGISGSCTVGDGVMIGGQVGMADHVHIGEGAVIAAKAGLMRDVEPGGKVGGVPAQNMRQWMKETAALRKLARGKS